MRRREESETEWIGNIQMGGNSTDVVHKFLFFIKVVIVLFCSFLFKKKNDLI